MLKTIGLLLALAWGALAQPTLDALVERVRKDFNVPGIAVAVVADGKLVHSKGYGVRKLGEPAPVTPNTLFGIASNTKAMTAAALAILVDEGKIQWDDQVGKHMPAFQMYDPYVTREMTVRDLLVHRSGLGLGAGDLMFFPSSDLSREEIVRRLRFVKPASSFRSRYAYDNILYLVAGQLIPAVTGRSWDDFLRERIHLPLGMTSTRTGIGALRPGDEIATPHAPAGGELQAIGPTNLDNNAPAGAVQSSIGDMARWVMLQLNRGELDGKRLFSARQSREMWSPHTIIPVADPRHPALAAVKPMFSAYGLGWTLSDYRGRPLVWHTGGLAGMVTRVTLAPDRKLGIIVLTNQESGGAFNAITYTVLDHYLGAAATDWPQAFLEVAKKQVADAEAAVQKASAKRNAGSRPALELPAYAGRYRDAWYGDVVIEERDGKLRIRFTHSPLLTGALEHWHYDTFVARWDDRTMLADAYVTFSLKPDGAIDELKMAAVSPLTDFSFDFHDLLLKPVARDAAAYD
ncbi:MAG: serine hydrolase [Bryobacterales bacterium]|nr:serine hydrolase [Bryobacterales bacterium]